MIRPGSPSTLLAVDGESAQGLLRGGRHLVRDAEGIEELGGGPHLNWSMLREGLVDELSLVLMPTADAEPDTHSLFEADERYAQPTPFRFEFISAQPLEDGSVWIRYRVVGEIDEG